MQHPRIEHSNHVHAVSQDAQPNGRGTPSRPSSTSELYVPEMYDAGLAQAASTQKRQGPAGSVGTSSASVSPLDPGPSALRFNTSGAAGEKWVTVDLDENPV